MNAEFTDGILERCFVDAVRCSFSFLDKMGFSRVPFAPGFERYVFGSARFKRGEVAVSIYYERRSYELDLSVERRAEKYSIGELIRFTEPAADRTYRSYAATTEAGVTEGVARLASLLREHGQRALDGDPEVFDLLATARRRNIEDFADGVRASQLRPEAEAAFRAGDYRRAADLYGQFESQLSSVEQKKLALAKKRAGSS